MQKPSGAPPIHYSGHQLHRVVEPSDHVAAPLRFRQRHIEALAGGAGQSVQVGLPRHIHTETELSQGRILVHTPRPGFYFGAYDLEYLQDNRLSVKETPSLFCGLMLSGAPSRLDISGHGSVEVRPGTPLIINFAEDAVCEGFCKAGTHCCGIGIRLTRDFFDSEFSPTAATALRSLRSFMEGGTAVRMIGGSTRLNAIADQTLSGPCEQTLQALYLEGLAFAFLAELSRLEAAETQAASTELKPHEYRRVRRVADFLDANLERSISLASLSRLAGVNATTLGRQFQTIHGETIFNYVRARRLERARSLLRNGEMPVSQVGYSVGFTSAAAFATAYRRKFGHPPSREVLSS
ncbi:AraC-like DNA-binding protein [Aquamicrobium lusatiense]|uniref:AraC-like DNA-binding protein n=1 Tax=Aquamicrobium lusatiense TaxID=89772 RepID=A0A7W9S0C0_9HYPH|nr:AraC family transcriptional regulator [Aquamicrobium lusatiense]MBB6011772.1 AraC-like DNA-binding protein [Aquamicrobium lusatiense]